MSRTQPTGTEPRGIGAWLAGAGQPRTLKVPTLTIYFWIVKILSTAMGESVSDWAVFRYDPVVVVVVGFVGFVAALALQIAQRRYGPWIYWLAVLMVSIFGTMAADVVHVRFGVPYAVSSTVCAVALAATFGLWQRTEGTLSIHSIDTLRRELFYWAAALVTFALGTATGDLTAITFHLGYLSSGILFAALFAAVAIAYAAFDLNPILAFWCAYVLTRPLGASFADWVAKPQDAHGLGHGDGIVSLVLGLLIVGFVAYLAVSHVDDPVRAGP
jgi:uncharacterized membrane-anchored protein